MNSKYKIFTYKSTMWADASGYYMYLPMTFIYHWNTDKLPLGLDTLTGRGFSINSSKNIVFTKYTSGIAYFQMPFFLASHVIATISGEDANGFTEFYVKGILFSGVFYLLLGLFLSFYVLRKYVTRNAALISCIALALGTNMYFYGIEHNGLTHIYSFFLISFILFHLQRFKPYKLLLVLPASAFILLIRPTNIIMLAVVVVFAVIVIEKPLLKSIFNIYTIPAISIALLVILPQMFYWNHVSGKYLLYSYQGEDFIYWKSPKILSVLFAPRNGFFTYAPIFFFAFWGFKFFPIKKLFTYSVLLGFILITYVNASWWCWFFGCAYGARAYIEYYPFLAFGLATAIEKILEMKMLYKLSALLILLVFLCYNILFIYGYDDCWYSDEWDYFYILKVLKG